MRLPCVVGLGPAHRTPIRKPFAERSVSGVSFGAGALRLAQQARSRGDLWHGKQMQLGLTEGEIEMAWQRIQTLLQRVDAGQIATF